jgi:hypothetical protein
MSSLRGISQACGECRTRKIKVRSSSPKFIDISLLTLYFTRSVIFSSLLVLDALNQVANAPDIETSWPSAFEMKAK